MGYSLDAIIIVQAKHGYLEWDQSSSGGGEKGMGENHFKGYN